VTLVLGSLAVLAAGAVLSLLLGRLARAGLFCASFAIAAAGVMYCAAGIRVLIGAEVAGAREFAWQLPLGTARMAIDGLSAWFLLVIGIVSVAVAIYSWAYMQAEIGHGSIAAFGALMCLLVASLGLVVCAGDSVLFLVAWEVMTLAAFFLVGYHDRRPEVRYAAWMYLVATHLGTTLCLLPMFAVLAMLSGTDFGAFAAALKQAGPGVGTMLFVLGLLGFGTKAGFMPMHVWLPNAHPAAPTPVSAFFSGVVIKTGIYGLLRLLSWLPPLPTGCGIAMLVFGISSGILGVLYALAQHDIKRLLAYHSVENIGIIALGIGIGMLGQASGHGTLAALGFAGALLHVLNHALFKGLLFLSAGAVIQAAGTGQIDRLGGLARKTPLNAAMFLVGAVSICGLPPFNGFVSEWLIYVGLFGGATQLSTTSAGISVVALASLALMGGLALACFAKVFGVIFLGSPREEHASINRTPRPMLAGMAVLALLCAAIGTMPVLAIPLTAQAVRSILVLPGEQFSATVSTALRPGMWVLAILGLVTCLLLLLRHWRQSESQEKAAGAQTWGCAYAYPTPRMQYTASSFAWPLISSFEQLLWPQRLLTGRPAGLFPGQSELVTHLPDMAEADLFAPIFRAAARLAAAMQTLTWSGQEGKPAAEKRRGPLRTALESLLGAMRRGSIQIYLTYIVVALMVLFAVEAMSAPRAGTMPPDGKTPAVNRGGTRP
jgi:hydrogenase-4 component B